MKKAILSLAMMIIAGCAFGQNASELLEHYKKLKGADYENVTKSVKKQAKKEKYVAPKQYDIAQRLKKVHYVTVELDERKREALTENIAKLEGYECLYQQKTNVDNMLNDSFTLFPHRQYYGVVENGVVKDGIIRVDLHSNSAMKTIIVHIEGDLTPDEFMEVMGFEEKKEIKTSVSTQGE